MTTFKQLPPLMVLLHVFDIDFNSPSGLIWRTPNAYQLKPGDRAGGFNGRYWNVCYENSYYSCARIIFYMETGIEPVNFHVDHVTRNTKENNSIRLATPSQNNANREKQLLYAGKPVSSKYKGVSWFKRDKKWKANITVNKKSIYLGMYESEFEAAAAYNRAALKFFGEFACLNQLDSLQMEHMKVAKEIKEIFTEQFPAIAEAAFTD